MRKIGWMRAAVLCAAVSVAAPLWAYEAATVPGLRCEAFTKRETRKELELKGGHVVACATPEGDLLGPLLGKNGRVKCWVRAHLEPEKLWECGWIDWCGELQEIPCD